MNLPPERRRRPWTLGEMLAVVAMIAANLALVAQVVGLQGGAAGWTVAGLILATNLVLCVAIGGMIRFRLVPLMAMISTAALTEALLIQSATSNPDHGWIGVVAALGGLLLAAWWVGMRSIRKRSRARR